MSRELKINLKKSKSSANGIGFDNLLNIKKMSAEGARMSTRNESERKLMYDFNGVKFSEFAQIYKSKNIDDKK